MRLDTHAFQSSRIERKSSTDQPPQSPPPTEVGQYLFCGCLGAGVLSLKCKTPAGVLSLFRYPQTCLPHSGPTLQPPFKCSNKRSAPPHAVGTPQCVLGCVNRAETCPGRPLIRSPAWLAPSQLGWDQTPAHHCNVTTSAGHTGTCDCRCAGLSSARSELMRSTHSCCKLRCAAAGRWWRVVFGSQTTSGATIPTPHVPAAGSCSSRRLLSCTIQPDSASLPQALADSHAHAAAQSGGCKQPQPPADAWHEQRRRVCAARTQHQGCEPRLQESKDKGSKHSTVAATSTCNCQACRTSNTTQACAPLACAGV